MPKATIAGILAINQLLKKYEHSATIPKDEREAALKLAWPKRTSKQTTALADRFHRLRQNGASNATAIVQMYREGYSSVQIASGAHLNKVDVLTVLHLNGLAKQRKSVYREAIEPNLDRIRELISIGYKRDEVAEKIGVTRNQLTDSRKSHPALIKAMCEGDEAWQERKAEIRAQTKKERVK